MRNADPTVLNAAVLTVVCLILATCSRLPEPGLSQFFARTTSYSTVAVP